MCPYRGGTHRAHIANINDVVLESESSNKNIGKQHVVKARGVEYCTGKKLTGKLKMREKRIYSRLIAFYFRINRKNII